MKPVKRKANYQPMLENRLRALFAYFRKARIRLERLPETPAATDDIEQAQYAYLDSIVLACCCIDALRVFRYGEGRTGFIKFLQNYSGPEQQRWYWKISCLYLDQPPLDPTGNLQRSLDGSDVASIRRILYGAASPDVGTDLSLDAAARRLARAGIQKGRDWLSRFSYAAYFYERYRCHGVHNVQPPVPGISGDAEPYYEPKYQPARLVFPRRFILDTLTACTDKFEAEVLEKLRSALPPSTSEDYQWFKKNYRLKSTFVETVCAYYLFGQNMHVPAAPLGSVEA